MTAPLTSPHAASENARPAYEARLAFWTAEATRHDRRTEQLGTARLLVFFVTLIGGIWILRAHPGWTAWLLVPVGLFIALVALHAQAREHLARARRGAAWHERNLARVDERWAGTGPTGEEHVPEGHLFARDLDLVGEASLFQLLCTTRSRCGELALARWLLGAPVQANAAPAFDAEAIRARQQAVAALAPEAELRERLALAGNVAASGQPGDLDPAALRAWITAGPVRFSPFERGIAVVLGVLAAVAAATWATGVTSLVPLLLVATLEAVFAWLLRRRMQSVDRLAESGEHALSLLSELLALLEDRARQPGTPHAVAALGAAVGVAPSRPGREAAESASARIARFDRLSRSLTSSRRNGVYAFFAFLLQIRVHRAHALERWRAEVAPALSGWLDAVGEFEGLVALAGYAHEHPEDIFPDIVPAPCLQASGLGHPLLAAASCVRNDVALDSGHALLLISGSNMSGKSTLLRAAGLAAVLGQAGAPVRARALRLSPMQVGACISIHDSLR